MSSSDHLQSIEDSMNRLDEPADNIRKLRQLSGQLMDPDIAVMIFELLPDAIVVVDAAGTIQLINRQAEFMFGYHRSELFDNSVDLLVPDAVKEQHSAHRAGFMRDPRTRPMGQNLPLKGKHRDGSEFWAEINLSPMATTHGIMVMAVIRKKQEQGQLG